MQEIGGRMRGSKKVPCAVQRSRASRSTRTQQEIIADYNLYTKYAGWALVAMFALVFVAEVLGW